MWNEREDASAPSTQRGQLARTGRRYHFSAAALVSACVAASAVFGIAASTAPASTVPPECASASADRSLCVTLAPAGGDAFVFTAYFPPEEYKGEFAGDTIHGFQVFTGAPTTDVSPSSCSSGKTPTTGAEETGTYYVTSCDETITPGDTVHMCYAGGGGIPDPGDAYEQLPPYFVGAPPGEVGWASSSIPAAPAVSGCPLSATQPTKSVSEQAQAQAQEA